MRPIPIFPTIVTEFKLNREFNIEEENFFRESRKRAVKNKGNGIGDNYYVLNEPPMKLLNDFIKKSFNQYLKEIVFSRDEMGLRITESWLNWTAAGDFHHKHWHQNSYLSGVFYIESEEHDNITFYKPGWELEQFDIKPKEYTPFNCTSWQLPATKGVLYIFPSMLHHGVEVRKESKIERTSLAVNSFLTGRIGDHTEELYL